MWLDIIWYAAPCDSLIFISFGIRTYMWTCVFVFRIPIVLYARSNIGIANKNVITPIESNTHLLSHTERNYIQTIPATLSFFLFNLSISPHYYLFTQIGLNMLSSMHHLFGPSFKYWPFNVCTLTKSSNAWIPFFSWTNLNEEKL